ncbi:MAG: ABC transporter substrate-binding protein [Anaerolineales bacterium]|nr:ABC transporter substrate-binding protein [Anaerolineales bacterium]
MHISRRAIQLILPAVLILSLLVACGPTAEPQIIKETVIVTKEVEVVETQVVIETVIVEGTPQVIEKVVTPTPEPPTPEPSTPTGGTFIFRNLSDPSVLNPLYAGDGPSLIVLGFSMNSLVKVFGADIQPDLAESWESTKDGLVWTFHLRQDVKWHDGEPFTADDVVFTYQAIQDEKNNSPSRGAYVVEGEPILFEAVDDYTVRVTLPAIQPSFIYSMGTFIVPEHVLASSTDLEHDPFNQKPIGTGPFQVVDWKAGEQVELVKFKDYFRGEPYLDQVVIRIIPDSQAATVAMQTGEIHIMSSVDPADISKLEDAGVIVSPTMRDIQVLIHVNTSHPILSDVRVRKAMMYGMDREAMVVGLEKNYAKVCDSIFHEPAFVYEENDPNLPPYTYDPAKAAELLDEAGWLMGDDGIRYKDGEPLSFTYLNINIGGPLGKMATVVQAQLRDIGFDIPIDTVDIPTFIDRLVVQECPKPYDVTLDREGALGPDPDSYYTLYYGPGNYQCYNNDEVNQLLDAGRKTADLEERKAIYQQVEEILWDELPILPMWYPRTLMALSPDFVYEEAILDVDEYCLFRYPEWIHLAP